MDGSPPIVTLTTDFGEGSRYVAAIKGVILRECPQVTIVDLTHAVPPQDIAFAARVWDHATEWFPALTIHLAVVDPGVGTDRELVYVEIDNQRYVCPDNGLLSCLAARQSPLRIFAISEPEFWLPAVTPTFHGRDIMAPVVGKLASGLDPRRLGPPRDVITTIPLPQATIVGQSITGEIVEIDSFGNLISNITADQLATAPRDESVRVACDGHETFGIFATYGEQPAMTLVAIVGSSGTLELAIVDDSAQMMLGVHVGAEVQVVW